VKISSGDLVMSGWVTSKFCSFLEAEGNKKRIGDGCVPVISGGHLNDYWKIRGDCQWQAGLQIPGWKDIAKRVCIT
jgi:hypothetical protein